MELILPSHLSKRQFEAALQAFTDVVGEDQVFATDLDRDTYADHFAYDETRNAPSAAVAPESVEQVQQVVRIANEYRLPLWTISRGKNFGYGGPAPRMAGSVVLDLSRLRKIEIDAENGTALVEPGVNFYDLYEYLIDNNLPYWPSVPGNSWGSVVGNALDRGIGYTPYGDHTSRICGLEVVLPDGDLVRTGMGAISEDTWQLYPYGFGPAWDQMFVQSNFGVVTKMGLWLMPEPESMLVMDMEFEKAEDLGWIVDAIAPLRRSGVLPQSPSIGNWLRQATTVTTRNEWYDKPGTMPQDVIDKILKHYNIGWWGLKVGLYGYEEVNELNARRVREQIEKAGKVAVKTSRWQRGQPREKFSVAAGVPITHALQNANWYGGRGGHLSFSPVLPPKGNLAMAQFKRTYDRYREFGIDYKASFSIGQRHLTNINQLLFDKDDQGMMTRVDQLFGHLVTDAAEAGYGEYRTHIDYMDMVADTYSFNNNALRRLNEKVKNALDPNGILAPGKSGIWPKPFEGERS